jgi:PilZ domain-containing protein
MDPSPVNTRRWPRHEADLPVQVAAVGTRTCTAVPGRGTEISEGGMALYVGIESRPHDLIEVEFYSSLHARITGVIRSRSGYCYGLEFLSPLVLETQPANPTPALKPDLEEPSEHLTPGAMKVFEKIRAAQGDAAAYAILARVLDLDHRPTQARRAIVQALTSFVRRRNENLRIRRVAIEHLRRELSILRRLTPLLADAQEDGVIDPGLPELIAALPKLFRR